MHFEIDLTSSQWLADEFWQALQEKDTAKRLKAVTMFEKNEGDHDDICNWLEQIETSRKLIARFSDAKEVSTDDLREALGKKIDEEKANIVSFMEKLSLRIRCFYTEKAAESVLARYRAYVQRNQEENQEPTPQQGR